MITISASFLSSRLVVSLVLCLSALCSLTRINLATACTTLDQLENFSRRSKNYLVSLALELRIILTLTVITLTSSTLHALSGRSFCQRNFSPENQLEVLSCSAVNPRGRMVGWIILRYNMDPLFRLRT